MKFKNKLEEKEYYEQYATEEEFIEWYKKQDLDTYERPSVTVDNVIFAYDKKTDSMKMLLIKRKAHPYKGCWALTGGFINPNEHSDNAVIREVFEETGIEISKRNIEQLYTFTTPFRDPRTWIVSIAYLTFLPEIPETMAGDDAKDVQWFDIDTNCSEYILSGEDSDQTTFVLNKESGKLESSYSTNLAFDHADIISMAMSRISGSLDWKPNILNTLGTTFTLTEVRKVFSKFMPVESYKELDNSNLTRTHKHLFKEVGVESKGIGRPSILYSLKY